MAAVASFRLPFVSVVLPARNEAKYIRNCLQSLLDSDYPKELIEFIVVDGDSDDETPEIVQALHRFEPRITLLHNESRTVPYAMNLGIRASRGEIIVRVDAHANYPRKYIRQCVHSLLATGADNVGGIWHTEPGADGPVSEAIALALTHPFGVGNAGFRVGGKEGNVDTVPFGAFRKSIFSEVGLFRETLTRHQDYELNSRIRGAGGRIYLDPAIHCTYFARPSLKSLWRQKFNDGKWCVYSWLVCPEAYAHRHALPGLVAVAAPALAVAAAFSPAALSLLIFFACAYLFLASLASIGLALSHKTARALLCPIVFPVLHFGHGIGVLYGFLTAQGWGRRVKARGEAPMLEREPTGVEERAA